ncbi:hypothetical protein CC80DRAFT_488224 [Byssothecium circinans]|uniref:Uncharacterized protein n=1 Tax=Byssothecium circinans TaxID=147558 RepID=A0A6A5UL65_9PLEO|nr:hypothetical protein CC80DRAFT_488224 [Byssothecium circinans]
MVYSPPLPSPLPLRHHRHTLPSPPTHSLPKPSNYLCHPNNPQFRGSRDTLCRKLDLLQGRKDGHARWQGRGR